MSMGKRRRTAGFDHLIHSERREDRTKIKYLSIKTERKRRCKRLECLLANEKKNENRTEQNKTNKSNLNLVESCV